MFDRITVSLLKCCGLIRSHDILYDNYVGDDDVNDAHTHVVFCEPYIC